jgi:putative transposase
VRARLVARAQDWRWSSVRAHLYGRDDGLTTPGPVLERFSPFRDFLDEPASPAAAERLRAAESIGRPVGDKAFLARLERRTKRTLQPAKRGPKPRADDERQGRFSALSP